MAHIRSANVILDWDEIEARPGVYKFEKLWALARRAHEQAVLTGERKSISMYIWGGGGRAPLWLYEERPGFTPVKAAAKFCERRKANAPQLPRVRVNGNGVHSPDVLEYCSDKVHTSYDPSECEVIEKIIPDYNDPVWMDRYLNVHRMAEREMVWVLGNYTDLDFTFMQPCPGATGDNTPNHWSTNNDPFYINYTTAPYVTCKDDPAWYRNSRWLVQSLRDDVFAHRLNTTDFTLLVNNAGGNTSVFSMNYIVENNWQVYIKRGQEGHQFQSYGERSRLLDDVHWIHHVWPGGKAIRSRGELSNEACWTGWEDNWGRLPRGTVLSPGCQRQRQQMYAMCKFTMTVKMDFWQVGFWRTSNMADDYTLGGMWKMVNRYGGVRWGWQSPGAIIGFRDGLDPQDTERWPIAEYGDPYLSAAGRKPRWEAILATASARGAVIEDLDAAVKSTTLSHRRANAINDVIPNILKDDYGVFMAQRNISNSIGWFNQFGHPDEMMGRFCRGFADPTNPDATIGLELDKGLWGGLPLKSSRQLTLRVAWIAKHGPGVLHLGYDSFTGPKTLEINYPSSSLWREVCWRIVDGRFGQAPNADDIFLRNADGLGEIFDTVEIVDTPNWEDISVHQQGCDNYDENGNLLNMPPPPSPPPCHDINPEWCSNKGARCDERSVYLDCQLTCGICALAPTGPPPPELPPQPQQPPQPPLPPPPPLPPHVPMDCKNWCGPGQGTWEDICLTSFRGANCAACPECYVSPPAPPVPVQLPPPAPPSVPMSCMNWCGPGQGTWAEICLPSFRSAKCAACPECASL